MKQLLIIHFPDLGEEPKWGGDICQLLYVCICQIVSICILAQRLKNNIKNNIKKIKLINYGKNYWYRPWNY